MNDSMYGPGKAPLHPGGGCWTCTHWRGEFICGGAHIICRLWDDRMKVKPRPDWGCAYWEREPGADDEIVYRRARQARGWFAQELSAPGPAVRRLGRR